MKKNIVSVVTKHEKEYGLSSNFVSILLFACIDLYNLKLSVRKRKYIKVKMNKS